MAIAPSEIAGNSDLADRLYNGATSGPTIISNKSTQRSVIIPPSTVVLAACRIVTVRSVQYDIYRLLSFSTLNTIGYNVPKGQLKFVITPGVDEEPEIDAPDEIYIFAAHSDISSYASMNGAMTGLVSSSQIATIFNGGNADIANRLMTGIIDRVRKTRDPNNGLIYTVEFSTNMKKFDITTEVRNPDQPLSLGAVETANLGLALAGSYVVAAARQSNVSLAYAFQTVIDNQSNVVISNSPGLSPDIGSPGTNGQTEVDGAGIRAFNNPNTPFPYQVGIPTDVNLTSWNYQRWSSILAAMCEVSFCELFFSRFGECYFRQFGGFRAAKDWDITIPAAIVIAYEISDGDDVRPITRLDVRYLSGSSGLITNFYTYAPANQAV